MKGDSFGNLEQWGRVLEQLDQWRHAGELDSHQEDLLWLLRVEGNWRLREAALEMLGSLRQPLPQLIHEACGIATDESLYHEVRILAAEAVTAALSSGGTPRGGNVSPVGEVRERLHALLESTQPPIIHLALRRVLPRIE